MLVFLYFELIFFYFFQNRLIFIHILLFFCTWYNYALQKIPYNAKAPINNLRESYQPKKDILVSLPIQNNDMDELRLYTFAGEKKELNYIKNGENISFTCNKFEPFVLVYTKAEEEKVEATTKVEEDNKKDEKEEVVENENFILIFIISSSLIVLLIVGIYYTKKNHKKLKRELEYAEELKINLDEKNKRGRN